MREGDRVLRRARVAATGVNAQGNRGVLGCEVGPGEDAAFGRALLRSLLDRGLSGVQWGMRDAHRGLPPAIRTVLHGASWHWCRVHALRNLSATVLKSVQALGAALCG